MLKSARCESCGHLLPLHGARWDLTLPPERIECPGCGRAIDTTFPYRVTWMEALLLKLWLALSVPVSAIVAWHSDEPLAWRLAIVAGGVVAVGGLGGLVASRVLGFPATLVVDRWRRRRPG